MSVINIEGKVFFEGLDINVSCIVEKHENGNFLLFNTKNQCAEVFVNIGKICGMKRFAACRRTPTSCWMEPSFGFDVESIPMETQFLIVEIEEEKFALIMPLVDKGVRSSLWGRQDGLNLVAETGDSETLFNQFMGLYIIKGDNPYELIETAAVEIADKLKTVRLLSDKIVPDFINYIGFCTWNAFYDKVSHDKVISAVKDFKENGVNLKFILLDDGWQSSELKFDFEDPNPNANKFRRHLISFEADSVKFPGGIAKTSEVMKKEFNIEHLFVWHVFSGYWQGVSLSQFEKYKAKDIAINIPERFNNMEDNEELKDVGEEFRYFHPVRYEYEPMGITEKLFEFYYDYYCYLREQGVDGVKVDAMTWIEGFGEGSGGRVKMMKKLMTALECASLSHFNGGLLNCSSCSNDFVYNTLAASVARTSTDFFPDLPQTHGLHILSNAHTSFWMGQFVIPDWDMFQSGHSAGAFHAAARAISGGPIYSADVLGAVDYSIMNKLSLSNGTIPRPISHARICKDCFFVNPNTDKKLIKIFNKNVVGGVVGAFNCCYDKDNEIIVEGQVKPSDVYDLEGDMFAVYMHNTKTVKKMSKDEEINLSLGQIQFELLTIIPINNGFAPIGLTNKYNSGGVISKLYVANEQIFVDLKDGGDFISYCEERPKAVTVNGIECDFNYDIEHKVLKISIKESCNSVVGIKM